MRTSEPIGISTPAQRSTLATYGKPLNIPLIRRTIVEGTQIRYRDPKYQRSADIAVRTIRAAGTVLTKTGNDSRFTNLTGRFGDGDLTGRLKVTMRALHLLLTGFGLDIRVPPAP